MRFSSNYFVVFVVRRRKIGEELLKLDGLRNRVTAVCEFSEN